MRPSRPARSARRLLVGAIVLWVVAGGMYATLRFVYGQRPAAVNVRWAVTVDRPARQRLEATYHLTAGEWREGQTWAYWLADVSRGNIQALVGDAAVEDTHRINRTTFRPWRTAPRGAYLHSGPSWIPPAMEFVALGALILGTVAAGLSLLLRWSGTAARLRPVQAVIAAVDSPHAAVSTSVGGIWRRLDALFPVASAEAAAAFRIVFGSACFFYAALTDSPNWRAATASSVGLVAVRLVQSTPFVIEGLRYWMLLWSALLVGGVLTRTSTVMFAAGVLLWSALYTTTASGHPVSSFVIAMMCLMWSRWGDAWSFDRWRRGKGALETVVNPRVYGYTLWVPGAVLGLSFVAAAIAKLNESGLAWIVNGTVKYHFLSDSLQARVGWGLQLARHDGIAVVMSLAAVTIEALVIVGALSTRYVFRALAGVAALLLLVGFWLFQGVLWPLWYILLLSFLPWHLVRSAKAARAEASDAPAILLRVQQVIVLIVVVQQVIASARKLEVPPFMSAYDMYSTTYSGPEDYEAKSGMTHWIVAAFAAGPSESCQVSSSDAEMVSDALTSDSTGPETVRVVQKCFGRTRPVRMLRVESRRHTVDWSRVAFGPDVVVPVAGPSEYAPD